LRKHAPFVRGAPKQGGGFKGREGAGGHWDCLQ
jgi:hypothetical protein